MHKVSRVEHVTKCEALPRVGHPIGWKTPDAQRGHCPRAGRPPQLAHPLAARRASRRALMLLLKVSAASLGLAALEMPLEMGSSIPVPSASRPASSAAARSPPWAPMPGERNHTLGNAARTTPSASTSVAPTTSPAFWCSLAHTSHASFATCRYNLPTPGTSSVWMSAEPGFDVLHRMNTPFAASFRNGCTPSPPRYGLTVTQSQPKVEKAPCA